MGKSSLVFSAIHEAVNKLSSKGKVNILPVLVNAPNFEIRRVNEKGEKLNEVDLLEFKRNLVRRLYQLTRYIPVENDRIKMQNNMIMYDESLLSEAALSQTRLKKNSHRA